MTTDLDHVYHCWLDYHRELTEPPRLLRTLKQIKTEFKLVMFTCDLHEYLCIR